MYIISLRNAYYDIKIVLVYIYTQATVCIPDIGIMVRVFANGPGDLGSISRSNHTKDSKNGT